MRKDLLKKLKEIKEKAKKYGKIFYQNQEKK